MVKTLFLAAITGILAQSHVTLAASSIKYLITFGDSYSQTGFDVNGEKPSASNPLGNPPFPGWTAAGGANWVGSMVKEQNNSVVLSYNFAYGGATVDANIVTPYTDTVLSMVDQVNQYKGSIAKRPAYAPWTASNALAGVWIGVNDVGNTYWNSDAAAVTERAVTRYFELLKVLGFDPSATGRLTHLQATNLSPLLLEQGAQADALLAKDIKLYNSLLTSKLKAFKKANSGVKALLVDTSIAFNKAINKPTAYGSPDATCYNEDGVSCLWFNNYHPGVAINRLVAEEVAKNLEANGYKW
ncbi:hypothetical protein FZEAL_5178 [Fusarium zealandicum]|uniref:Acetylesterase n=1 Tax=Fusarium zealandicum TaxID=1053134 RepID=A0A8H4UL30_9HYPO|nr:hypothetical protein FZEAL_5178 [Fusarium zealandicum]